MFLWAEGQNAAIMRERILEIANLAEWYLGLLLSDNFFCGQRTEKLKFLKQTI